MTRDEIARRVTEGLGYQVIGPDFDKICDAVLALIAEERAAGFNDGVRAAAEKVRKSYEYISDPPGAARPVTASWPDVPSMILSLVVPPAPQGESPK